MTITANSGPLIIYGQLQPQTGATNPSGDNNGQAGPNLGYGPFGQLDTRAGYQPGQSAGRPVYGWVGSPILVADIAPPTLSAVAIAPAALAVVGTPITLVSSSAAGILVGQSVVNAATGATVTGLLCVDTAPALVQFGSTATLSIYDPRTITARCVSITSAGGDDTNATFLVSGYDVYGYPMSERITGTNASVASGKKAFKFIASVVPAGTIGSTTVSVGTLDLFGFPLRSDRVGHVDLTWNNISITTATTYVAAVTTSPATTTTGDVRGTVGVPNAADGTKRLQVFQTIPAWNLPNPTTSNTTGLLGVTQA